MTGVAHSDTEDDEEVLLRQSLSCDWLTFSLDLYFAVIRATDLKEL